MDNDPLRELVVDEEEIARGELAEVLVPYVRFGEGGNVLPLAAFDELTASRRVACVLLAFRAMSLLRLRGRPGATPQEVIAASGMPGGTVRPKLSQLLGARLVVRDGRDYVIPASAMRRVARDLRSEPERPQGVTS